MFSSPTVFSLFCYYVFPNRHSVLTILNGIFQSRRKRSYLDDYPYNNYGSLFQQAKVDPLNSLSDLDMYKLVKILGLDKKFLNQTVTPAPRGPTKYEPEKWNKYFIKDHNNCYNYANNRITDTFAQPGRAGKCEMGLTLTGLTIEKLSLCDGLKTVPAPSTISLPRHSRNLVALVFWPPKPGSSTFDFHWYRYDNNLFNNFQYQSMIKISVDM